MASIRFGLRTRRGAGVSAPPAAPLSPWRAGVRRPLVILVPVLMGLCLALAIGLTRQPVYEAQVRMGIQLTGNVPAALSGYGAGAEQLVQGYARALAAREVTDAVKRRTGLSAATLGQRTYASIVPGTPIFVIHARGPNAGAAVAVATATGEQLVRYVADVNSNLTQSERLLARYAAAQRERREAMREREEDQGRYFAAPSRSRRRALADSRADVRVASDRVKNLEEVYRDSTRSAGFESLVQVISAPRSVKDASSDRSAKLQLLAFAGTLAGFVVGIALALVLASRDPAA